MTFFLIVDFILIIIIHSTYKVIITQIFTG